MELTFKIMDLTFKVRLEILLLITVVWFLLVSHLCCSCTTVSAVEALTMAKQVVKKVANK